MEKLLTLRYYFNPNPGPEFKYWIVMLVFAGILVVIASLIKAYRKKTGDKILRKMLKSYPTKLIWFGAVAVLLTLVRLENISLFSMRFLWIVYFAILIYVIVGNVKTFYREYPRKVRQSLSHQVKSKYLPGQTKKGKKK